MIRFTSEMCIRDSKYIGLKNPKRKKDRDHLLNKYKLKVFKTYMNKVNHIVSVSYTHLITGGDFEGQEGIFLKVKGARDRRVVIELSLIHI